MEKVENLGINEGVPLVIPAKYLQTVRYGGI